MCIFEKIHDADPPIVLRCWARRQQYMWVNSKIRLVIRCKDSVNSRRQLSISLCSRGVAPPHSPHAHNRQRHKRSKRSSSLHLRESHVRSDEMSSAHVIVALLLKNVQRVWFYLQFSRWNTASAWHFSVKNSKIELQLSVWNLLERHWRFFSFLP